MDVERSPGHTSGRLLRLPIEILREIIFNAYQPHEYWNLAPLALVCREFHDLVTPEIYANVILADAVTFRDDVVTLGESLEQVRRTRFER